MKQCPLCESQYTDETLRFCLQDGMSLVEGVKQSAVATVAFSNPVTAEKIMQTEELRVRFRDQTRENWSEPPIAKTVVQTATVKSGSSRAVWITVVPVVLILSAAGALGWFYFGNQNTVPDKAILSAPNNTERKSAANTTVLSSESLEEKPAQALSNSSSPGSNADSEQIKKEVADFINSWKELAEARNLAEYTSKYAETVEYYDKPEANIKEIRAEIQKLFSTYSDIDLALSNMRIAVEADGLKATAVFDKEWSYEKDKDLIEGKAHTKLQFQKNGPEWKIVSEKHLKVYYTEN